MSAKAGGKSSTKSSSNKPASKTRKKASDLEKEIILLHDQLEQVQEQLAVRTENYEQVVKKIIMNCNCELFDVDETTDVFSIVIDDVMEMLSSILTRTYGEEDTIEVRVEELETRVTKQNMDIALLSKQLLSAQYVLEDISKCNQLAEAKRLASEAGRKLNEIELTPVPPITYVQTPDGATVVGPTTPRDLINSNRETVDTGPKDQAVSDNSESSNLIMCDQIVPVKRLPGTTHINNMKPELRYLVIKEVSFNKTSGRDWRLFAERVGVSNDVTDRLRHMRVQYPMAKILTAWGESPGATVRMLHRHLVSPQLGFSVLGKHLADVYEVD